MTTLQEVVQKYSQASRTCNSHEIEQVEKACEVLKHVLKTRAVAFVHARADSPILIMHGADGTPLTTRKRYTAGKTVRAQRHGRQCTEFLIQRIFLQDSIGSTCVFFTEPEPLQSKHAWCHFEAFRCMFDLPRQMGHHSICVHAHCFDRALFSSVTRHLLQYHAADELDRREQDNSRLLECLSWFVSVGCINHDHHNGLKFSALELSRDKSVLKSAFVTVESLRNGFSVLMEGLGPWLKSVVVYEDWAFDDISGLWTTLGVAPEWVEVLVRLQVRFQDGRLKLAAACKTDADARSDLEGALLHVFAFRRFSDSRWATLGPCGRTVLAACALGLPSLVEFLYSDDRYSKFYIGGFRRNWEGRSSRSWACSLLVLGSRTRPSQHCSKMTVWRNNSPRLRRRSRLRLSISFPSPLPCGPSSRLWLASVPASSATIVVMRPWCRPPSCSTACGQSISSHGPCAMVTWTSSWMPCARGRNHKNPSRQKSGHSSKCGFPGL